MSFEIIFVLALLAAALNIIPLVVRVIGMILTNCLNTANTLGVSAYSFLFAVTFSASLSFITPFGYQTNTLIYGVGQCEFTDFTKVGLPISIIFWILATIFIPMIWPF